MSEPAPLFVGSAQPLHEPALPPPLEPQLRATGHYIPSTGLAHAVEVAMLLGQPLLLTGEPGTGKTTLASALAHERFGGRMLEMQVKSDSGRDDLLYSIDEMGIFRDSQAGRQSRRLMDYLSLRPLGEAILRACPADTPLRSRGGAELDGHEPRLDEVFGADRARRVPTVADLLPTRTWSAGERIVVLIDEIDKAPRDTPNDLLEEFDRMAFAIPEFGISVRPPAGAPRPVVVVTSNSEKGLPDAFLRRCAYHHIAFPDDAALRKIIATRLAGSRFDIDTLDTLLDLFNAFRSALQRPPGTAEMLQWLTLFHHHLGAGKPADAARVKAVAPLLIAVVAKNELDAQAAAMTIQSWVPRR